MIDITGVKVIPADTSNPLGVIWSLKIFRTSHIVMAGGIHLSDKTREALIRFAIPRTPRPAARLPWLRSVTRPSPHWAVCFKKMTGADLVGIHEIAPELLSPEGLIAGTGALRTTKPVLPALACRRRAPSAHWISGRRPWFRATVSSPSRTSGAPMH